jgi:hypothetical protein
VNQTFTQNNIQWSEAQSEPWHYEYLNIYIDDVGIQGIELTSCPSKLGNTITESAPLLPYEEIQGIARKYFSLNIFKHSTNTQGYDYLMADNKIVKVYIDNIIVDKVVLGYMRVKQGNGGNGYVIIPVWDFIGRECVNMDYKHAKEDIVLNVETLMPEFSDQHSFLTINAIDGSIIDRSLGY